MVDIAKESQSDLEIAALVNACMVKQEHCLPARVGGAHMFG